MSIGKNHDAEFDEAFGGRQCNLYMLCIHFNKVQSSVGNMTDFIPGCCKPTKIIFSF